MRVVRRFVGVFLGDAIIVTPPKETERRSLREDVRVIFRSGC